jgi:predicted acylesterase/phospholipase RssA
MTDMKAPAFASISGGGPGITYLAGAAAALDVRHKVLGWAGVSAGALVAVGKAFHVDDAAIHAAIQHALTVGNLLRFDPSSVVRGGVVDWDVLGRYVDRLIGHGTRMGKARTHLVIGVTNLDQRRPLYLTREKNPDVKVREAVMASCAFMAGVTPACSIPSLGTVLSPDVRLFADGGYTDNTVDQVWDAQEAPRVLLRLAPSDDVRRVRPGDVAGIHGAVMQSALWASSQPKSKRVDGCVVDVDGGNSWDFRKDPLAIEAEWRKGYDSASAALRGWMP